MNLLFLYINAFSKTGGIQQFNRNFLRALNECMGVQDHAQSCSLHDQMKDLSIFSKISQYSAGGSRLHFILRSIRLAFRSDKIIFGHVNLIFPLAIIFKTLFKKKLVLISHGIEIWRPLPVYKRICLARIDLFIAVSSFTKEKLIAVHGIEENRIVILHNTLDPDFPLKELESKPENVFRKHDIPLGSPLLLTVCRISDGEKYKGYDRVIQALQIVKNEFPGIQYIIAGKYDEMEKARILNIVKQNNLDQMVHFTGYVSNEELSDYYRACDLFIMPSRKEGFGIVFLEALVNGKVVIAGNRDGSADALMNGELGILIDPDNNDQIAGSIKNVLSKNVDQKYFNQSWLKKKCLETFGFPAFTRKVKELILPEES